jgi:hypothetical protein
VDENDGALNMYLNGIRLQRETFGLAGASDNRAESSAPPFRRSPYDEFSEWTARACPESAACSPNIFDLIHLWWLTAYFVSGICSDKRPLFYIPALRRVQNSWTLADLCGVIRISFDSCFVFWIGCIDVGNLGYYTRVGDICHA